MNRWHLLKVIMIICISLTSLLGCTRLKIIDKLSIIHVFGFDMKDDQLVGVALYPNYTNSRGSDDIKYLKEEAPSGVFFSQKMDRYTSTPVQLSKIRVLVLGKEYAETGIRDMVDRFIKNPNIGTNIQITASEQSAEETLLTLKKEGSLTLLERLQQYMQIQNLPKVNLHVFLNHFYGEGMDAYVPMIRVENDTLKVEGLGIFKDDKLKLKLNDEQAFLFAVLVNYHSEGLYPIDVDKGDRQIIVRGFSAKKKWEYLQNNPKPELKLTLNLKWVVTQYPDWINPESGKDIQQLKKMITRAIKSDIEDLLSTLKEHQVDPLGIGNIVRARDRKWNPETFYEQYPNLPIDIEVNLEIIHSGLEA